MINGLHVTIPGEEVRRLLEQRMEDHRQRAEWWSEGAYLPEAIPHPLTSRSGPYHLEMSLAAI